MAQQSSESNKLDKFITRLGKTFPEDDLELTGEEIADVLWLGLKLQEFGFASKKENVDDDGNQDDDIEDQTTEPITPIEPPPPPPGKRSGDLKDNTSSISDLPPPKARVYSLPSSYSNESSKDISNSGLSIKIPDPPSVRDPLDLIKSLRLLMRKVPSGREVDIDEEATVKRIVDEQIWVPILKNELEPWLDLALVIDESQSMLIWGHYIEDLQRIFKQYGIFRELTIWGIKLGKTEKDGGETNEKLQFIARNGSNSRNADPYELIEPTKRRLILITSDCVSNLWRKGIIFPTLKTWAAKQPLAILQMLPRVMWRKSALGLGMLVNFSSFRLGVANQELIPSKIPPFLDPNKIPTNIPILSLEKEQTLSPNTEKEFTRQRLFRWTEMLLGKRESLVSGYLLPPELKIENFPFLEQEQTIIEEQDAEQRIARFRRMTSPLGRKLAGLLAAAPVIRLPIVRLIQESLLPSSDQTQVAEVFLGGLLKPKAGFDFDINTNPETVEYEFIKPEIRDLFIEDAPISDSTDVLNAVSRYITEQLGISMSDFMALLKSPGGDSDEQNELKPFAEVTVRILKKLGGDYIRFAEEIEANILGGEKKDLNQIELLPLDVVVAKITFDSEPEPPQQLEFETVTVDASGTVIKTETHRANYYEEPLGDNIPLLVMMGIPEGEFIMGSPENEPQRYNSESPQHKVKVAPFWLAQTPITKAQWNFVANLPQIQRELNSKDNNSEDDHTVIYVSWYDAIEFCARLSRHTGRNYRLPSEAEWEYACRAGTTTPFHFGATITSKLANYNATSTYADEPAGEYREKTVPVKSFRPNAFGLYDMHGQVWEWCADPWHKNYQNAPGDSRVWDERNDNDNYYQNIAEHLAELLKDDRLRVRRGGSWLDLPRLCRSAFRLRGNPDYTFSIGVRVACGGART